MTPIRCTTSKNRPIYSTCGALLGAIDGDIIYFHCPSCKKNNGNWIKVYRDETDGLVIEKLPIDIKLNLNNEIAMII